MLRSLLQRHLVDILTSSQIVFDHLFSFEWQNGFKNGIMTTLTWLEAEVQISKSAATRLRQKHRF